MSPRTRYTMGVVRAIPFCFALSVTGCGTDDIQFNGGIFDAVGLSDATKTKAGTAKVAARAPLVVPPSLERLPTPGTGPTNDQQIADIKDYDAEKVASKEVLEREQAAYCKVHYDDAKVRGDDSTAANASGPLGPCRKSVLTSIKKWNSEDGSE